MYSGVHFTVLRYILVDSDLAKQACRLKRNQTNSGADGITDCPSSVVVVRRPSSSVNFCFKSLLLLQFLFDHSEFFTGETRHIVPPCNKAGISNFCLEFQKFQKFQISSKRYSSFSSYSIILNFLLEKLGIQCHPVTKPEFQISAQNSRNCRNIAEIPDFFKTLLLLQFLFDHSEIFTGETRHIVPPCNKAGISNFCLELQKLQKFQIS